MKRNTSLKTDQRGIASIVIVIIMIMIITLITLAMSRNATKEQRQTLDRQLSSQAFYAAESGVNDTIDYIRKNLSAAEDVLPKKKTDCNGEPSLQDLSGNTEGQVGGDAVIKYTCILYDREPETLEFGNVSSSSSTVVPIQNGNGTGISSITISWDAPDSDNNFNCGVPPALPQSDNYPCSIGMLRLELIDTSRLGTTAGTTDDRADLINNNFMALAYPAVTGSPVSRIGNVGGAAGVFAGATCDASATPRKCSVTINNVGASGDARFYLRMKTLYRPSSSVVISALAEDGVTRVPFKGGQITIDSTGKANDVLRRIQVRVPVIPKFEESDYALKASESICKMLNVYPGQTSNADPFCDY